MTLFRHCDSCDRLGFLRRITRGPFPWWLCRECRKGTTCPKGF